MYWIQEDRGHFRRSESVGEKITAKTAVNFLEIEVWQEKRGDKMLWLS